jgi:hypothetical protein
MVTWSSSFRDHPKVQQSRTRWRLKRPKQEKRWQPLPSEIPLLIRMSRCRQMGNQTTQSRPPNSLRNKWNSPICSFHRGTWWLHHLSSELCYNTAISKRGEASAPEEGLRYNCLKMTWRLWLSCWILFVAGVVAGREKSAWIYSRKYRYCWTSTVPDGGSGWNTVW